jgi:hypothetical protein
MVIKNDGIERLKSLYSGELDARLRARFLVLEAGLGAIILQRELGVGINNSAPESRLERAMLALGAQAELRRERIVEAFRLYRAEVPVNFSESMIALWPDAELPEGEQNIDCVLAFATPRYWYTVVNFYMKVADPDTNEERIALHKGEPVMMPALFKGARPSGVTNPKSQTARYFPDSPVTPCEWRALTELDMSHLSLASGFSIAQLEQIDGSYNEEQF